MSAALFSTDAERQVLGACLVEGDNGLTLTRCQNARLSPSSFYQQSHGEIYKSLLAMHRRGVELSLLTLAEELRSAGLLDAIGGYTELLSITSGVPTTTNAGYFIDKVRELDRRRQIKQAAAQLLERATNEGEPLDDALADFRRESDAQSAGAASAEMPIDTLLTFDTKTDPDSLLGFRYLGRTGGLVIVAPSGVGKSVLSVGLAWCAALGRHWFGVKVVRPLSVLYVQAEDDIGDVAEAMQGFVRSHALKENDIELLKANLRVVRWNDAAGDKFLARLQAEYVRWPYDLVIINPFFSFYGGDVSSQAEMSAFLRNGLNPVLNAIRAACVIIHHTNKPIADTKKPGGEKTLNEDSYAGSGSAELTNWARAYITLQNVKPAGPEVYKMTFAKRGKRAGLKDEEGKSLTSVFIEYAKDCLCWLPSSYEPEKGAGGKFKTTFNLERARAIYNPTKTWAVNSLAIAEDQRMSTRAIYYHKNEIETGGAG